jgi:Protein of unknown function (DUF732)
MTTCHLHGVAQRRVIGTLSVALGVLLTGAVIATPVAHTCCGGPNPPPPVGGDAFVNDVKSDGITTKDGSDQAVMNMGSQICGEVYNGATSTIIAIEIAHDNLYNKNTFRWVDDLNPVTWQQATDMVRYAYNDMCPGAVAVYGNPRTGLNPWQ